MINLKEDIINCSILFNNALSFLVIRNLYEIFFINYLYFTSHWDLAFNLFTTYNFKICLDDKFTDLKLLLILSH